MPSGKKSFVMGLVVVSAADKSIRCVVMTIEGLVVFDAQYDHRLVIKRGIAPFDSEGFTKGLIKDIQLIFFKPPGPSIDSGLLINGSFICRYQNHDNRIVDIIIHGDHFWEIKQYTHDFRHDRTVRCYVTKKTGPMGQPEIPDRIELTAHGPKGYRLVMNLVEAVPLIQ